MYGDLLMFFDNQGLGFPILGGGSPNNEDYSILESKLPSDRIITWGLFCSAILESPVHIDPWFRVISFGA